MSTRTLVLSITRKDLRIEFMRGSGKGGQNRNKRDTACRITHPPSGASGYSCDQRSQGQNRKQAFLRMANSDPFRRWLRIETGRASAAYAEIQAEIGDYGSEDILVERRVDGAWTEWA